MGDLLQEKQFISNLSPVSHPRFLKGHLQVIWTNSKHLIIYLTAPPQSDESHLHHPVEAQIHGMLEKPHFSLNELYPMTIWHCPEQGQPELETTLQGLVNLNMNLDLKAN